MFKLGTVLVLLAGLALSQSAPATTVDKEAVQVQFNQFKTMFNKKYVDAVEEEKRRALFEETLMFIAEHNEKYSQGLVTYDVGVNQFADWSPEEFKVWLGKAQTAPDMPNAATFLTPNNVNLPASVDWRTKGYVTPVKDQGQCGSCWSFSATGALEGQHFHKTGKLVSLSEQNLVDCAGSKYGNFGCNGGWPFQAYDYVKANNGIDTEASYPYEARNDQCRYKSNSIGATLTGYTKIAPGSEDRLQQAVGTIGPVSICIDASHRSFQSYKSGVYNEPACSSSQLDHAVLAVGYGSDPRGGDYWLVKNSWATTWGEQGYIRMSRNKNNQCGVATAPVYPIV
jgi:cathepsin L